MLSLMRPYLAANTVGCVGPIGFRFVDVFLNWHLTLILAYDDCRAEQLLGRSILDFVDNYLH
jgi:hypothetical protein